MARDTANHGTHASGEIIYTFYLEQLVAFANLVAAKKQERIIEVVERLGTWAHITEVVAEIRGEA